MGRSNRRGRRSSQRRAQAMRPRRFGKGLTILVTIVAITAAALFLLHRIYTGIHLPTTPAAKESAAATQAKGGFDVLKGRWLRPDGGYVVEVRDIDANGHMVAAYFNPLPISVSRAEASQEGGETKVFIELRDINYPGATYNLTYDPAGDQLSGVYYQAALQQSFDVVFVRMR